jgi:hypothetical protein
MNYKIKIFKQVQEQGTFFIAYFNTDFLIGLVKLDENETEEQAINRLKAMLLTDNLVGTKLDEKYLDGKKLVDVITFS